MQQNFKMHRRDLFFFLSFKVMHYEGHDIFDVKITLIRFKLLLQGHDGAAA